MKSSRLLLFLSAASSLIFLVGISCVTCDWLVVFKVSSILPLAILGFRVNSQLGTALTLGAIGDFLLGVRQLGSLNAEKLFLFGLGAFLVGHLVYIAMFRKYRRASQWKPSLPRTLGILAIVVTLASVLGVLHNSLGPLLTPVVLYALVLAAMGISALLAELGSPLAAIGALCFVASDAMLAVGKFHGAFPGHTPLIWITYYLAQLFIFLGVAYRHIRPPVRP
jgi:uncharacterized membrane protein YhhN